MGMSARRIGYCAIILICAAALAFPAPCRAADYLEDAGEGFAKPNFRDLSQMLASMGGIDIKSPKIANEYAKIFYCGLYKSTYKNDFDWNKVRSAIVDRILSGKAYFRTHYELVGSIDLERYDFDRLGFPLSEKSSLRSVNSMVMYDAGLEDPESPKLCGEKQQTRIFPTQYNVTLAQTLTVVQLKFALDQAKGLIERLEISRRKSRRLYIRLRLHITDVESLSTSAGATTKANMKGEISQVDIFYDPACTKFLTSVNLHFQ